MNYNFTIYKSSCPGNNEPNLMYTTTSLTASVPLEGIFSSPSPAQYLSSTTTSTGSINVIAGDRICMVLNSSLAGTPPALDEVSFSAGVFYNT